jgi:hypothetical protein
VTGIPSEALTWRRLRPSPKVRRTTSRIFRMATRGLGTGSSSNNSSGQGGRATSPHASATSKASRGCTKTPEQVYGFNRNGCMESSGIRTFVLLPDSPWWDSWATAGVSRQPDRQGNAH